MDPRAALRELYCKIGITALLIAIFALDRSRSPAANALAAAAAAVVAALVLYLLRVARRRAPHPRKGLAYALAFIALLGILGGAVSVK
jgi:hypothetical protein